jgi:hypothetical protein
MGTLALAGQRDRAERDNRYLRAESAVGRAAQRHAGDPARGCLADWLGEVPASPDELRALLMPCPAEDLALWPVDKRVGNVKNNDPPLVEPVALAGA